MSEYLDRFSVERRPRTRRSAKPTLDDLKKYLREATKPTRAKPDLALNMEIADLVNQLKGDASEVVCKHVASHLRHLFGQLGTSPLPLIALSILDACVKNCGYAFHLQIARKDFLNKMVASFSYRPPASLSPAQLLILEMIEEWNLTLVKHAVYKQDLQNIRDMHRLLASRGYRFPKVSNSELVALTADSSFKSASELEQEEMERNSIKMAMLLNSKNPEDLKEANRLMSILSGYQQPTDFQAKAKEDLDKLRNTKDLLMSACMSGIDGERDAFEELAETLRYALPKLERLEDEDAHVLINEIKGALKCYEGGETTTSLIDIDEGAPVNQTVGSNQTGANDLLDLLSPSAVSVPSESTSAPIVSEIAPVPVPGTGTGTGTAYTSPSLVIKYSFSSQQQRHTITLTLENAGTKTITNLQTLLAQPKSLKMELEPLTKLSLQPKETSQQKVVLVGEGQPKLRFKVNYGYGMDKLEGGGDIKL